MKTSYTTGRDVTRARLNAALGALGEQLNDGQIYVPLGRLERAGLVAVDRAAASDERAETKLYSLTAAGQSRVAEWLSEVSWPKPDLAEFHLKLIAAASAGLADPVGIIAAQRRELLRRLRDVQDAALEEPQGSRPSLLLEGIALRLQADVRWLETCETAWSSPRQDHRSMS